MYSKHTEKKSLLKQKDEELVELIQKGNKEALSELFTKYIGLIYKVSFQFMVDKEIAQMYFENLYDIALDGLYIACRDYRKSVGTPFINFWWSIVERRHLTYWQELSSIKNIAEQSDDIDRIGNGQLISNAIEIIAEHKDFTVDEKIFLTSTLLGFKPLEIAEQNGWNRPKLYRTKSKAMDKLNKIFKSN